MRRIERREFAKEAGLAFLSGVTVTVTGCGGGGGSGSYSNTGPTAATPPPPDSQDEVGEITGNHGHRAVITAAQLMAGGALELDIEGDAGHPHIISLPAEAVSDIREARPVQTRSTTTDAHAHTVTFNAESPETPTEY